MKNKLFGFLAVVAASALVLTSCNGDDHDPNNGNGSNLSPTTDPGVVINGVKWATRNVDAPGTFAATPQCSGMFYQWNRRVGWSSTDPMINSNGETTWDGSMPTWTAWYALNCPCPPGWRVPTREELTSLHNSGSTWVTNWNDTGVNGHLYGISPYQIFLPAAGFRYLSNGALGDVGAFGHYWSSPQYATSSEWILWYLSIDSNIRTYWRTLGFSVRCVAD